jgi:hypothetical protein
MYIAVVSFCWYVKFFLVDIDFDKLNFTHLCNCITQFLKPLLSHPTTQPLKTALKSDATAICFSATMFNLAWTSIGHYLKAQKLLPFISTQCLSNIIKKLTLNVSFFFQLVFNLFSFYILLNNYCHFLCNLVNKLATKLTAALLFWTFRFFHIYFPQFLNL